VTTIGPFSAAVDLLAALRRREVSSAELTDACIERIARHDDALNAVVVRDFERARNAAVAADRARALGSDTPLLGLPMTIKDCMHIAGLPTTSGVAKYADVVAGQDSPVVASVRAAGAVLLGKTNTPPYAGDVQTDNPLFGRTNNPWNLERTPGGSSGGSAAAVAVGLTGLDIGSDLVGSIRQPAAFCGVYGHKPSETAIPRTGHVPGGMLPNTATCMDVQGPLARSADDLALALDVLAGPDIGEDVAWRIALPPPRHDTLCEFRVALLPNPDWLPVSDDILAALDRLAGALAAAGATVATAQPAAFGDLREHHRTYVRLMYAMISHGSPGERAAAADTLRRRGRLNDAAHADGLLATASDYLGWCDDRERFRQSGREFFRDHDILLAPNHCVNAFPHDRRPPEERDLDINGTASTRRSRSSTLDWPRSAEHRRPRSRSASTPAGCRSGCRPSVPTSRTARRSGSPRCWPRNSAGTCHRPDSTEIVSIHGLAANCPRWQHFRHEIRRTWNFSR
jgi:amidase